MLLHFEKKLIAPTANNIGAANFILLSHIVAIQLNTCIADAGKADMQSIQYLRNQSISLLQQLGSSKKLLHLV
jgi:hypothetical protein